MYILSVMHSGLGPHDLIPLMRYKISANCCFEFEYFALPHAHNRKSKELTLAWKRSMISALNNRCVGSTGAVQPQQRIRWSPTTPRLTINSTAHGFTEPLFLELPSNSSNIICRLSRNVILRKSTRRPGFRAQ
ncbi:hypothetical protein PILCRDRAFT_496836 [Piloderma croceum F 1598]|uniref:Uncharacterized protein n=1 Tax=Piloderma croceum (strain F 1598) TaxID=765440 RepID=A0A0C3FQX2_PILCF|nr:hypothetical protein PILCRDRAFT_496836 [Piloderma croceum F 1598]